MPSCAANKFLSFCKSACWFACHLQLEKPPLVGVQRAKDALAQAVDAGRVGAVPVAVRPVRVQRGGASVNGDEPAAADGIVHGAQRAEAELLDLARGGVVGVAAGPLEKDALQLRATGARDRELPRGELLSQAAWRPGRARARALAPRD